MGYFSLGGGIGEVVYNFCIIGIIVQDTYSHDIISWKNDNLTVIPKAFEGCAKMKWCPNGFGFRLLEFRQKQGFMFFNNIEMVDSSQDLVVWVI